MNFKGFRKVQTEKDYTVLEHPAGHQIRVAHKVLNEGMRKQLDSLPVHMKEGGLVKSTLKDNEDTLLKDANPLKQSQFSLPNAQSMLESRPEMFKSTPEEENKIANSLPGFEPLAPPAPAMSVGEPTEVMQQSRPAMDPLAGINSQIAGVGQQMDAQGRIGREQADIYQQQQDYLAEHANKAQQLQNKYATQIDTLSQDLRNSKVDPSRLWNNKSVPGKISSVIGILVGGLGAGLTGRENMAIETINRMIDQDIDAQKADMANKGSMLNILRQQYGDDMTALNMAKAIQIDQVASKLNEVTAKYMPQMSQAQKLQVLGPLIEKKNALIAANADRNATLSQIKGGTPDRQFNAIARAVQTMVPEGQRSKALEEVNRLKELSSASNEVKKAFEILKSEANVDGKELGEVLWGNKEEDAAKATVLAAVKGNLGQRVSPEELKRFEKLINVSKLNSPQEIAKVERTIQALIGKSWGSSQLESVGIPLPAFPGSQATSGRKEIKTLGSK